MAEYPVLASADELMRRLSREFDDLELDRAEAILEDVSEFIRFESGKLWLKVDSNGVVLEPFALDVPGIVRTLTLRVAERAVRNPEGFSSESAGDYSYQRNGATGEGGIYLTERELAMLRRAGGRTGLWTQSTTRFNVDDGVAWFDTMPGTEPMPLDTYLDC